MKRDTRMILAVVVGLVILIVPLVIVSFVSLDLYDMLDVDQERIFFRVAYPLLYMTGLLSILLRSFYVRKDRYEANESYEIYGKLLILFIVLDVSSFVWLFLFRQISLSSVFHMFLFLQVAIISLIRTRLISD